MISTNCPKCGSHLGEGLDLRKSSCHNCGYVDYSPEPEAQIEEEQAVASETGETKPAAKRRAPAKKRVAAKKAPAKSVVETIKATGVRVKEALTEKPAENPAAVDKNADETKKES